MAKTKNLLFALLAVLFLTSSVSLPGCSSSYTKCFDCTEAPLSWQSEITAITGTYIQTACATIDLSKVKFWKGDFKIGDVITFKYVIKQGEFCAPGDKSIYRIEAETNSDAPADTYILTDSKAILKK